MSVRTVIERQKDQYILEMIHAINDEIDQGPACFSGQGVQRA